MSDRRKDFSINARDRRVVGSILQKITAVNNPAENTLALMSFDDLKALLDETEYKFVERTRDIDPRPFGFKGEFHGITQPPADLVALRGQTYKIHEGNKVIEKVIPTQYLPYAAKFFYYQMNEAMKAEIGEEILVDSGYRSPANQVITLLTHLKQFNFDIAKTLSLVAVAGFSEHGNPFEQAMDLATPDGIGEGGIDLRFAKTKQYQWLLENASLFGFDLSYPEENAQGIDWEPWHWRFRGMTKVAYPSF